MGGELSPNTQLSAGVSRTRKCRDIWCLLLFIVFWIGMFFVCQIAVTNGDLKELEVPKDYLGNFCGVNNVGKNNSYADQSKNPVLYFINPTQLADLTNATYICLPSCPNVTQVITDPANALCQYGITPTASNIASLVYDGTCAAFTYASTPVISRCIPTEPIPVSVLNGTSIQTGNVTINLETIITSGSKYSFMVLADLQNTWPLLLVCAGTAIIFSFIWLFIAQFIVGIFVWITLILVNCIAVGSAVALYFYWQSRKVAYETNSTANGVINIGHQVVANISFFNSATPIQQNEVTASFAFFVTVAVIAGILLLITIVMVKRISMAIEIINEASAAFRKLPGLTITPVFLSIVILILMVYFLVILLYLSTITNDITVPIVGTISAANARNMIYYHVAGFIWTYYTIFAISETTAAGAVAEWYWMPDKTKKIHFPVMRSLGRVFRYHLGSMVLGAAIITIVELIRLFLFHLQQKVSKSKVKALKYIVACAQCCMLIVEKIVKFVNKNAYVFIAITGKAFFKSAGAATALLLRNAAKTVAVNYVADATLFLTKLIVIGANCVGAYCFIVGKPDAFKNPINFPAITVVFVSLETYLVASIFFGNYHLAIDTIFLSVLEDLDINDGSPNRPYLMTDRMKRIMHKKNEKVNIY
ncbi:hypothetical protein HK103_003123 [Boothiomyces macroporosus]|uniref:Protein PNS1 n=1 Tax=Boothiomyces macroporosus TaxID=261099 RepID=A0AAD5UIE7_9FUNG|nr:hypothetical protein HK103_003123 [Boothiomyces macroporosus]